MTGKILVKSMRTLVGLATLMLLAGCATATRLSHGSVPCQEHEMQIVDEQRSLGSPDTWTVNCRGKTYYCSARYGGQYGATEVSCIEVDE